MKICKKCGGSIFYKCGKCKPCDSARSKKYREDIKNGVRKKQIEYLNKKWNEVKTCRRCGSNDFVFDNRGYSQCRECRNKYSRSRKDKRRIEYVENREKILSQHREWYLKNKEKCNERHKNWRNKNPEKMKSCVNSWRERNPKYFVIHGANRRNRQKGVLSSGLKEKLYKLQKGKCACCNLPLGDDYHLDHIMPLALGGENIDSNIQLLRAKCNLQKHSKHPIDYMQSKGFLL